MHTIWSSPPNNNGQFLLSPVAATVVYSGSEERYPLPLNPSLEWTALTAQTGLSSPFSRTVSSVSISHSFSKPRKTSLILLPIPNISTAGTLRGQAHQATADSVLLKKALLAWSFSPSIPGAGMFLFEILTRRKSPLKIPGASIFYTWWFSTT